ncbi:MAG: hypothetical protein AB7F59_07750 [Bdellovibrionales bacterium]
MKLFKMILSAFLIVSFTSSSVFARDVKIRGSSQTQISIRSFPVIKNGELQTVFRLCDDTATAQESVGCAENVLFNRSFKQAEVTAAIQKLNQIDMQIRLDSAAHVGTAAIGTGVALSFLGCVVGGTAGTVVAQPIAGCLILVKPLAAGTGVVGILASIAATLKPDSWGNTTLSGKRQALANGFDQTYHNFHGSLDEAIEILAWSLGVK